MFHQVTQVCPYGASTWSYRDFDDARKLYQLMCNDPKTLYAQFCINHEVEEQYFLDVTSVGESRV